jgi:hypothetical protein
MTLGTALPCLFLVVVWGAGDAAIVGGPSNERAPRRLTVTTGDQKRTESGVWRMIRSGHDVSHQNGLGVMAGKSRIRRIAGRLKIHDGVDAPSTAFMCESGAVETHRTH